VGTADRVQRLLPEVGRTVEVSFAGRMMDDCPITRFRTAFVSRTAPDPTENTREKIPVENDG
jgi:hypothetical protein